jgi:hypothetical protein
MIYYTNSPIIKLKKKRNSGKSEEETWPLVGVSRNIPCQLVSSLKNYEMNKLYSSVGYVVSQYSNFSTAGTDFLIAPDMVLTAAHNVMFNKLDGEINTEKKQALKIGFYLRYDNGKKKIPVQYCTSRLPQQWVSSFHHYYDFCVLFLPYSLNEPGLKLGALDHKKIRHRQLNSMNAKNDL